MSSGGSDALGRVAVLCRQVSAAKEKELKASAKKERFSKSVREGIDTL